VRVLICLVIEAENSMYVCVCGKLRALSHDQSDAKLRIGVTGCFTIIFIFMHAESITEEGEILERLLPGPGVLRHLSCCLSARAQSPPFWL
jgi:hypothetical protein